SWTTPLWERLEPEASQPGSLRAQVADLHARALLAAGDAAAASAVDAAAQPVRSAIPREGLPLALRARQKERVRSGAWAGLALFGLAAGPPAARTWAASPRPTPRGLLPLVVVGIGAGGLVALWDASLAPSFLVLVSILASVHIIAAGALAATPAGPWRHGQRAMAIIGTLAAAWLAADASGLAARVGL
ncbi:MAG: hypothetical protein VX265_10270, partial [Myxococcota bacterium]|nr:hypothetical protein [Myxococcota bacterium]